MYATLCSPAATPRRKHLPPLIILPPTTTFCHFLHLHLCAAPIRAATPPACACLPLTAPPNKCKSQRKYFALSRNWVEYLATKATHPPAKPKAPTAIPISLSLRTSARIWPGKVLPICKPLPLPTQLATKEDGKPFSVRRFVRQFGSDLWRNA